MCDSVHLVAAKMAKCIWVVAIIVASAAIVYRRGQRSRAPISVDTIHAAYDYVIGKFISTFKCLCH